MASVPGCDRKATCLAARSGAARAIAWSRQSSRARFKRANGPSLSLGFRAEGLGSRDQEKGFALSDNHGPRLRQTVRWTPLRSASSAVER